jgi:hypothetical protein
MEEGSPITCFLACWWSANLPEFTAALQDVVSKVLPVSAIATPSTNGCDKDITGNKPIGVQGLLYSIRQQFKLPSIPVTALPRLNFDDIIVAFTSIGKDLGI